MLSRQTPINFLSKYPRTSPSRDPPPLKSTPWHPNTNPPHLGHHHPPPQMPAANADRWASKKAEEPAAQVENLKKKPVVRTSKPSFAVCPVRSLPLNFIRRRCMRSIMILTHWRSIVNYCLLGAGICARYIWCTETWVPASMTMNNTFTTYTTLKWVPFRKVFLKFVQFFMKLTKPQFFFKFKCFKIFKPLQLGWNSNNVPNSYMHYVPMFA